MRVRLLIAIGVVGFAVATAVTASAQGTTMRWTVDGEHRAALVFPPASLKTTVKHPLVFAFHGHGGNMHGISQKMHIHTLWKEAIVVYPQGMHRPSPVDPQGTRSGWQVAANQPNVGNKDLDFFDAMLATMRQKYRVDDNRIYVAGFSNGAIFSFLLWSERGETLAAIAECAGILTPFEHRIMPRPLLAIAGEADTVALFALQQQAIEASLQVNHAKGLGQPCGQYCTLYPSTSQTPVKTLIHPGGHEYPSWASAHIVKFFAAHQLPYF